MNKAELRFIDDVYYVTYGKLKIRVDKLLDRKTAIKMPDGTIIKDGYTCETIFKAACCLNNLHLENDNGEKES